MKTSGVYSTLSLLNCRSTVVGGLYRRCLFRTSSASSSTETPTSSNTSSSQTASVKPHLLKAITHPQTFSNVDQLVKYMKHNFVLHQPGRFLILPKPFGISCVGHKLKDGGVFKDSVHNKKDEEQEDMRLNSKDITLEDCIPALSRVFSEPQLQFCIGLKRYVSGPIVLPCNNTDRDNMIKSVRMASVQQGDDSTPIHRALVFVIGRPPSTNGSLHGYCTFQAVGNHKQYIFVEGQAKRRAKSGKFAVEGSLDWKLVGHQHGVSLLDISVNKFARHLPRVFLSHMMCPILGDAMYMNRLIELDGKPALLPPNKIIGTQHKTFIPPRLLSHLGVDRSVILRLPLMFHVYRTVFPSFGRVLGKKKHQQPEDVADLVAALPPPGHVIALAEALGLSSALSAHMRSLENDGGVADVSAETRF